MARPPGRTVDSGAIVTLGSLFKSRFPRRAANTDVGGGVPLPRAGAHVDAGDDPDQKDIIRFQSGDAAGFEALMERYRHRAYGLALGFVGNHDDAMDAVQKSFIRIHRSLGRFRVGEPFFPWFYRIVRNTALNQKRDESRHRGDCPLDWVTEPARRARGHRPARGGPRHSRRRGRVPEPAQRPAVHGRAAREPRRRPR